MSDDTTDFIVVPFNPVQQESDKDIIRQRILGKTNEEIVDDTDAFNVLCTLGSDLNINAFACNFRINGQVNDDVEEANYLNNRVFSRFSVTQPSIDPKTVPLFLSSTVFAQADYGDCVRDFQTYVIEIFHYLCAIFICLSEQPHGPGDRFPSGSVCAAQCGHVTLPVRRRLCLHPGSVVPRRPRGGSCGER